MMNKKFNVRNNFFPQLLISFGASNLNIFVDCGQSYYRVTQSYVNNFAVAHYFDDSKYFFILFRDSKFTGIIYNICV